MDNDLPGKIPDIDPTQAGKPIGSSGEQPQPEKSFESYMKEAQENTPDKAGQAVSPFELAQSQQMQAGGPTLETIHNQMKSASGTLGDLQNQLNTKNLKLKQSQKYLLRNKLSEADSHIRTAASKVGVDTGKPPSMATRQNPIKRYLAYVSDGQNQLAQAQAKIKEISDHGGELTPGQLLLIQVKMNKAQQALEYSSVLLSKAVEDIKMLFNVQI